MCPCPNSKGVTRHEDLLGMLGCNLRKVTAVQDLTMRDVAVGHRGADILNCNREGHRYEVHN